MPEKDNSFEKKKKTDRDLFTDEADIFGEELTSRDVDRGNLPQSEQEDSSSEDGTDLSYEDERPASPVRRILLIAASIVVGIGLGVGGYFFFTAGSKQAPVEKKITRALPEPAPVPAPAAPAEKSDKIPEIPVKSEPQEEEAAPSKKVPVQKAEAERPKKETAPAAAATSSKKKPLLPQETAEKEVSAAITGKGAYYVQAGLFENEKNASALASRIRQKGFTPETRKMVNAEKKTLYRVTVGSYSSARKAAEVSETLRKQDIQAIVKKQ